MPVRGSVEPEEGFDSFQSSAARLPKDNIPGNDESHLRAGAWRTVEAELAADMLRALAHSLETEMPLPALRHDRGFHAAPIVTHKQR